MGTRHVTTAEFDFGENAQSKIHWGPPATFSCNARGEVWPSTRFGPTLRRGSGTP